MQGMFGLDEALQVRLQGCHTLPSPPAVAERILILGQNPDSTIAEVTEAVALDPALAAKLMRLARSPLYTRRRKADNLRQVIAIFGVNGTLTLALTFSLAGSLREDSGIGMDYAHFWKRSITTASLCKTLAERLKTGRLEELFLAGLLQDVGMLALDQALPELYRKADRLLQHNHYKLRQFEYDELGTDHAAVGGWLLNRWSIPDDIAVTVAHSHAASDKLSSAHSQWAKIAAAAGEMADFLWSDDGNDRFSQIADHIGSILGFGREELVKLFETVGEDLADTARLFDVEVGDESQLDILMEQAKEVLMLRNLHSLEEAAVLEEKKADLEARTAALEEKAQRDVLTGLYNRAFLDKVLKQEFDNAERQGWPLSVAFIDLDHFKSVNDSFGHEVGDKVLQCSARLLSDNSREHDIAARYGGEEFVIVLPGAGKDEAYLVCKRILMAFRRACELDDNSPVTVTASIGVATYDENNRFQSAEALLRAADRAVYAAKTAGRNCLFIYTAAGVEMIA